MDDQRIIALYWAREEEAIAATQEKYGRYLTAVARNILADGEDSRESVNDTYLRAWNSMPPHRPALLQPFLAKITRELAIDRLRARSRQKRGCGEYALTLDELSDVLSGGDVTQEQVDARQLARAISDFLRTLSPTARTVFLCRYFYCDLIRAVADAHGMTPPAVKSLLHRTRVSLRHYLEQEGFSL